MCYAENKTFGSSVQASQQKYKILNAIVHKYCAYELMNLVNSCTFLSNKSQYLQHIRYI